MGSDISTQEQPFSCIKGAVINVSARSDHKARVEGECDPFLMLILAYYSLV
jgi:hypothetical protein